MKTTGTTGSGGSRWAGFPEIGTYRPGKRSREVITSDAVEGVLRPKWTRAMGDLGSWPSMFRFKQSIFLSFPHVDGHRGNRFEASGRNLSYVSRDEGRTWEPLPSVPGHCECVVVGDTIYDYTGQDDAPTLVRTSKDGLRWSEPREVYEPSFWLWGVIYDPASRSFWAPAHCIPKRIPGTRQIHLVRSDDGFAWEHVSTVHYDERESESTLRFELDRTLVIVIRKKQGEGCMCWVAAGKPPYRQWDISERPFIAEGEHFREIGGRTFLATRALYRGRDPRVLANRKLFIGRRDYSAVHRFTPDRQIRPWAVMDSMGDCSYPQLVETPTEILCAYYSQHEDEACKVFLCGYDKAEFLRDG